MTRQRPPAHGMMLVKGWTKGQECNNHVDFHSPCIAATAPFQRSQDLLRAACLWSQTLSRAPRQACPPRCQLCPPGLSSCPLGRCQRVSENYTQTPVLTGDNDSKRRREAPSSFPPRAARRPLGSVFPLAVPTLGPCLRPLASP